nr:nucleic acid-binding, OB-fold protein [Tanacetum cinerariifolium]
MIPFTYKVHADTYQGHPTVFRLSTSKWKIVCACVAIVKPHFGTTKKNTISHKKAFMLHKLMTPRLYRHEAYKYAKKDLPYRNDDEPGEMMRHHLLPQMIARYLGKLFCSCLAFVHSCLAALTRIMPERSKLVPQAIEKGKMTLFQPDIISLQDIRATHTRKIIKVRVYRKWIAKNVTTKEPTNFCCILLDKEPSNARVFQLVWLIPPL